MSRRANTIASTWSNYALVRATSQLLRWGGTSRTASLVSSVVLANAFFTLVEVKDGYKPQYGFSWQDYQFNVLGEALGALLELYPELDRRFDYRLEYFPSKYYRKEFASNGINSAEDYSGQRLLIAYHLSSIRLLDSGRDSPYSEAGTGIVPPVNISQDDDNFYVRAVLPGFKASDIVITALRNRPTIAGRRDVSVATERTSYHRRERAEDAFSRVIPLPTEIVSDRVDARYADGILVLTLPKAEETKTRHIVVKS